MRYDIPGNLSDVTLRRRLELRVRGKKSGKSVKLRQVKKLRDRVHPVAVCRLPPVGPCYNPGTLRYPSRRALRNVKQLWNTLARGRRRVGFLARVLSSRFRRKFPRQVHSHIRKYPLQSPRRSPRSTPHALASMQLYSACNMLDQINLHAVEKIDGIARRSPARD